MRLPLSSLRERWGDIGSQLWQRLHGKELQVISPLIPRDPVEAYIHFDEPVAHSKQIMTMISSNLEQLFLRLDGLGRFAYRLELIGHCEYSDKRYQITVEPVSPSRDLCLFKDLLEQKLEQLKLENPFREIELFIHDVPEKVQQLTFFDSVDNTEDRWRRLISFVQQNDLEMGFFQRQASHFPEKSFRLITDKPENLVSADKITKVDNAIQIKSFYGKSISESPRPALLLEQPQALNDYEVKKFRFVSSIPSERIESSWWSFGEKELTQRDYFFALSHEGQLAWLFQDRLTEKYYLHGYFD